TFSTCSTAGPTCRCSTVQRCSPPPPTATMPPRGSRPSPTAAGVRDSFFDFETDIRDKTHYESGLDYYPVVARLNWGLWIYSRSPQWGLAKRYYTAPADI